jgi:hypothetical protein
MALNQFFRNQLIQSHQMNEMQHNPHNHTQRNHIQHNHNVDNQTHFTASSPENIPIENMGVGECVAEYLAIDQQLKTLRAETRKWNKRSKLIQTRMCELLKSANKNKIDINKQITLSYEVKKQQVPLTKKNIRKTLETHLSDPVLIEKIYEILTEKRDTYETEKLKKKKYKE